MSHWPFDPAKEPYVSLVTYRRSGAGVATPVWLAESEGRFCLFTEGAAGKVKRIRSNGRARLAACDFRGKVRSEWLDARATLATDAGVVAPAHAALRRKHGWQMRIGDFFSKLTGRFHRRAFIELDIVSQRGRG